VRTKIEMSEARSAVLCHVFDDAGSFMVHDTLTNEEDKELRCLSRRDVAGALILSYEVWSCGGLKLATAKLEDAVSAYNAA
jgi:hypothetical protein